MISYVCVRDQFHYAVLIPLVPFHATMYVPFESYSCGFHSNELIFFIDILMKLSINLYFACCYVFIVLLSSALKSQ